MATISNGENGLSVRNKLNAVLEKDLGSMTWAELQAEWADGSPELLALPQGSHAWIIDLDARYERNSEGTVWRAAGGGSLSTEDVGTSRAITAADAGKVLRATAAITLTWPTGLSPQPEVIVIPPLSGVLLLATSGGVTLNGSTGTLERSRGANPAGVYVTPTGTNTYGVSGS